MKLTKLIRKVTKRGLEDWLIFEITEYRKEETVFKINPSPFQLFNHFLSTNQLINLSTSCQNAELPSLQAIKHHFILVQVFPILIFGHIQLIIEANRPNRRQLQSKRLNFGLFCDQ